MPPVGGGPTAEAVVVSYEAGVIFLEPLSEGTPTLPLTSGLDLQVDICERTVVGSEVTLSNCLYETAVEQTDFYGVRWDSDKQNVDTQYSILVKLGTVGIGELLVSLEQGGSENAGRTFPIKFWVGGDFGGVTSEDVVKCETDPRCDVEVVSPTSLEPTRVTTVDETGQPIAELTFPVGSVPEDLVVTVDCRAGGYPATEGPLQVSNDQWPLFCEVTSTKLDGTAFTGELNTDANLEICKVDDTISGEEPFHPPEGDVVRLAKAENPTDSDVTLLPEGASTISSCQGITRSTTSGVEASILDLLDKGFETLLRPFMPAELHADMFRDGGVTALLGSFSIINPVSTSSIGGSISGLDDASDDGIPFTLSGGFLEADVTATTTDGAFSFDAPLLAAPGGTTYTVTLNDAIPVLENPVEVVVDGTGNFDAEFFAVPQAVLTCIQDDRCDGQLVRDEDGDQDPVVIQAKQSPTGPVVAELTIDPDILPEDLVVTLDCRATLEDPEDPGNSYSAGDGPLPTDLNQYPVFCHVDALTSGGSDFTGLLNGDAILDICVIDESLSGLSAYHPSLETRLGKSNGPGDFVILPEAPNVTPRTCEGVEILASNPGQVGFLESIGSRFAALFEPLMPQPLHADMFRDGGVTALLGSFSDINPVEPAFIGGTVTGAGVGLAGVDLELSGGALTSPLPTATTDPDGTYSFSEALNAAEGGGTTYTVTVTGGTVPLAQFLETSKQVSVTGSGAFTADFEAVGVLFDGATLAGGSGVVWDWVVGNTSGTDTAPFATTTWDDRCSVLHPIQQSDVGTDDVWPLNTIITLTKQFFVPAGTTGLTLTGWIDNDAKVLLNGNDITATSGVTIDADGFAVHENCANLNPLVFTAGSADFTAGAINTFVISVKDRGVIGYADFELSATSGS